jgi:hypothetical protein
MINMTVKRKQGVLTLACTLLRLSIDMPVLGPSRIHFQPCELPS